MMPAGAEIGGYRLVRVIGTGAMGTVYAVHDPELPRLDALKVLSEQLSTDPDFRARFLRESDIAATLDHPHIVSVYDRGETTRGQLWIAMQYIEGTDADAAVRAGTMTPARAVHIITAVGEALDYAHRRGVLHRDVKPANFLLSGQPGPEERVLLTDFGIARAVDDAPLTATGSVMASFAYAAPEVISGQPVDGRADLYSLGCSLFELLTATIPYADANGATAQAMAHLRRPPPRVSDRAPGLPAGFDDVIATALHKQPEKRYRSGAELAGAAAAALQTAPAYVDASDEPTVAAHHRGRPDPAAFAVRIPSRRPRRRWIAPAAALAVLVAAGAVGAAVITTRNTDTAAPATTTRTPSATTGAAPEPGSDLPSLLPPVAKTAAVMGTSLSAVDDPRNTMSHNPLDNRGCVALVYAIQDDVYRNTGAQRVYARLLQADDPRINTAEAVIEFSSAQLAATFLQRQQSIWQSCADTSTDASLPGKAAVPWTVGSTSTTDDGTLTAGVTSGGDVPLTCQRALTARNNIVVDVRACRPDVTDQAVTLAAQIAGKIPT